VSAAAPTSPDCPAQLPWSPSASSSPVNSKSRELETTPYVTSVPVVLMRGGTSKGVFLHASDLPPPGEERDRLILDIMGSPDPMQIDGLGGTYSSTSKVIIVAKGEPPDDVIYWFGQVGIDRPIVDWAGNCGNLTTAVGAFAIDEGVVESVEPVTQVRLRNGNTGVAIIAEVPVRDRRARSDGNYRIPGVPGSAAPIATHYLAPGGGVLGAELPTGSPADSVATPDGSVEVSLVDVTHPYAFVAAEALGLSVSGTHPDAINADAALLQRLERLRGSCAVALGQVDTWADALDKAPVVPRLILVGPTGDTSQVAHLSALAISMGRAHRALPMTGALCCAAAVKIPGTVPNRLCPNANSPIRIAHPKGVSDVVVQVDVSAERRVRSVGVVRTARRLVSGTAFLRGRYRL